MGSFAASPFGEMNLRRNLGAFAHSSFGEARFENFTMRAHSARIVFNLTVLFLDGMLRSAEWAL